MTNYSDVRIFLCTTPTNMNYSFDRLMGRAQEVFEQDPTSGHLFLFWNKDRDRMKILFWDRDGFCIWYKRLERGMFQLLTTTNDEEGIELNTIPNSSHCSVGSTCAPGVNVGVFIALVEAETFFLFLFHLVLLARRTRCTTVGAMDDTPSLPNDLAHCQRLLLAAFQQAVQLERQAAEAQQRAAASEQQVAELTRVLDKTAASYQELQQEHAATLDELAWYKRWAFGQRRERFVEDDGQRHLFELDASVPDVPEDAPALSQEPALDISGYRRRKRRTIDWDKLVQIRHEHDLDEDEKTCSCCGRPLKRIGEDVTRELEYEPAKLVGHIHVRAKYACCDCKDGVSAAPLPARPIPGGIAGPGLLAEVIVSKFSDHLPLYRLEDIVVRYGVYLSRSTLCDWVKSVAQLLQPLYDLQRQLVLQSSVMWTDDTYITVLGGREGSFRSYFWTYVGDEQHPYSVYGFTNSRTRAGPTKFLEHYVGYLHADAYTGYDAMFLDVASGVQEVACWELRGASSSTPLAAIPAKRIRSWSGSGSCRILRIARAVVGGSPSAVARRGSESGLG